jgi:hypothetical protein
MITIAFLLALAAFFAFETVEIWALERDVVPLLL